MRITERQLRKVIRQVIRESIEMTDDTVSDRNIEIWQDNARSRGYQFNSKIFKVERDCGSRVVKPGDYILMLTDGRGNEKITVSSLPRLIESIRFQFFCKHDFDLASSLRHTDLDVSPLQCGEMVSECNGEKFSQWLGSNDYWSQKDSDWQYGVYTF